MYYQSKRVEISEDTILVPRDNLKPRKIET